MKFMKFIWWLIVISLIISLASVVFPLLILLSIIFIAFNEANYERKNNHFS